ncbi:hypothetical protein Tco_1144959 [Tanacetum coccineum]
MNRQLPLFNAPETSYSAATHFGGVTYEESQDPNFDPFADLDLILPTYRNREGNNVETEGDEERQGEEETEVNEERQGEEETEVDEERHGEEKTKVDKERQGEEETEVEDESDSEDSDYLVDEDNNVDDVDVDMEDFEYNIDEEVEFVGCRDKEQPPDIEEGDAEEIEVLDNDYFESASNSDDDGMDDNDAFVGSQSKKATTQAARSATSTDKGKAPTGSQSKNKGKAPATTGVPKKTAPRKKIIKLG